MSDWDGSSNQKLLREIVIANSEADKWTKAKKEWDLVYIFDQESHCICNHSIMENCEIRNRHNGNRLIVGNVCINHFDEPDLRVEPAARKSLQTLSSHTSHTANESLIDVALRTKILSPGEANRYIRITTGRGSRTRFDPNNSNYDDSATFFRDKINRLITLGFSEHRPQCQCGEPAKPRMNGKTQEYFYSCYDGKFLSGKWTSSCWFKSAV